MISKNNFFYNAFHNALKECHDHYDTDCCLIKAPHYNPGYSTGLSGGVVHPIRDSLSYAVALLDSGKEEYRQKAFDIINKVISLQDADEDSDTFGSWSWYLEEPLDKMLTADLNWADFMGRDLVYLIKDYNSILSVDLLEKIKGALNNSATCSKKRNVQPDYTNICLMGIYVVYMAGKVLENDDFLLYGKNKLNQMLEYTRYHGGFTEFNSPTYNLIALGEIGRMLKDFNSRDLLKQVEELNECAWSSIAEHFHMGTGQLAAPHARSYIDLESDFLLSFVQAGLGESIRIINKEEVIISNYWPRNHFRIDLSWPKVTINCPQKFHYLFANNKTRFIKSVFYKGKSKYSSRFPATIIRSKEKDSLEARTYLSEKYSFGTFTKCDLWNQRRAFKIYLGERNNVSYFKVRCLKNGTDFASAFLFASQVKNHSIAGVNFVTDYGDTHICIDNTKGIIKVKSLVVRFEFGGKLDHILMPNDLEEGRKMRFETKWANIDLTILKGFFDGAEPTFKAGSDNESCWIDVILYKGDEKAFNLESLKESYLIFGLSVIGNEDDEKHTAEYSCKSSEGRTTEAFLSSSEGDGCIKLPKFPCSCIENFESSIIE